jgi:hypothetical protein
MVRDEIQKQSAGSKKRWRKYKKIIKNGEFCLLICIEIVRKKKQEANIGFLGARRMKAYESRLGQKMCGGILIIRFC